MRLHLILLPLPVKLKGKVHAGILLIAARVPREGILSIQCSTWNTGNNSKHRETTFTGGCIVAMKKRRLGKGLEALIESEAAEGEGGKNDGVLEIPLARIDLNPYQPRIDMDEERLNELADSIRSAGILQPIAVRPPKEGGRMYELIMGERRLRAARRAGLESVPAIVREIDDAQMLELALIENVQREDLHAIEKAVALKRMCDELGMTQQQSAQKIGLRRSTVTNLLRLLELPEEVQEMVSRGTLSAGHARTLLSLGDSEKILALARKIISEGLSVRAVEKLVAAPGKPPKADKNTDQPPPHLQRLQAVLSEALHADVNIKSRGNKGRFVIHFDNHEEFERLFSHFTGQDDLPV